jgi:hypothetical protein
MTPEEHRAITVAFKQCFATDAGTVVLEELSRFCMERRSTYVRPEPGADGLALALATAFNEGSRTVILEIRRQLEANLEEQPPEKAINEEET